MLKNAIAYILRKRNRTIIVFIILTVVLSCLYSCLNKTYTRFQIHHYQ